MLKIMLMLPILDADNDTDDASPDIDGNFSTYDTLALDC